MASQSAGGGAMNFIYAHPGIAPIDGRAREGWFEHSCWSSQGNGGIGAELEVAATEIQSKTSQGLLN